MRATQWMAVAVAVLAAMSGCLEPGPEGVAPAPPDAAPTPTTTELAFEATIRFTHAGSGAAQAYVPLGEHCLQVLVPRGWVPVRATAASTWTAQSPAAADLWLAFGVAEDEAPTVAVHGPSPQAVAHEWDDAAQASWREAGAQEERRLRAQASLAVAGAAVEQEVHLSMQVLFAKHPEHDDVPHAVPCPGLA